MKKLGFGLWAAVLLGVVVMAAGVAIASSGTSSDTPTVKTFDVSVELVGGTVSGGAGGVGGAAGVAGGGATGGGGADVKVAQY